MCVWLNFFPFLLQTEDRSVTLAPSIFGVFKNSPTITKNLLSSQTKDNINLGKQFFIDIDQHSSQDGWIAFLRRYWAPTELGYVAKSKFSPDGDSGSNLLEKTKDVIYITPENIDNLIMACEILNMNLIAMQDDVKRKMGDLERGLKAKFERKKLEQRRKRWIFLLFFLFFYVIC